MSVLRPLKTTLTNESEATTKPKRTRICEGQSKHGCFTCKARRIKCDESRPTCLRCARFSRVCEGYPEGAQRTTPKAAVAPEVPAESSFQSDAGCCSLILAPTRYLRSRPDDVKTDWQHRLGQTGIGLISHDSFVVFGSSGAVLDTLLPQLCYSMPAVNSAAIALGAVYDLRDTHRDHNSQDEIFAASQYQAALRTMHREFTTQPHGPVPLILMCFMLGVTEILLQQEKNALFHLRAAYKLLLDRKQTRTLCAADQSPLNSNGWIQEDDLDSIFRTLDLETCTYALGNYPDLPVASIPSILPSMTDLTTARVSLVQLVHACYAFTSQAWRYKYHPRSASAAVHMQQGRLIAHLSSWLEAFNLTILSTLPSTSTYPSETASRSHALTLRVTATCTLIYLSCILSPHEESYDAHATHFQQIITDGEEVISLRTPVDNRTSAQSAERSSRDRFTAGLGIINPLYITAIKYRHPQYRRQAIALLLRAGQEGPWYGRREANVAARVLELEEESTSRNTSADLSESYFTTSIRMSSHTCDSSSSSPDFLDQTAAQPTSFEAPRPAPTRIQPLTPPLDMFPPERHRIHGTGIIFPGPVVSVSRTQSRETRHHHSSSSSSKPDQTMTLVLSRCRDITTLLSCTHGPWFHKDPYDDGDDDINNTSRHPDPSSHPNTSSSTGNSLSLSTPLTPGLTPSPTDRIREESVDEKCPGNEQWEKWEEILIF